ncbi:MAG TPA: DUF4832 domain-containing protein [Intrasporangium sp.]|uniref:DUF4832 domain-containing protein n=1 Tax=Intrasporangium sp. TaxID=1925024 RepID=UPI002D76ADA1|nr:DUF4832 domain-containing protein [Intrasporangium sp.]HET7398010.1 DUF4832 domain-containing protein [Intrasporangium sp.]
MRKAILASVAAAILTVTSAASALSASVVSRTFSPSTAVIANPDRGLYHYTETHSRVDGSGYAPLDAAVAARWRTQEGVTLVYRVFYLERFVGTDGLSAAYLSQVRADLAAARAAGVKLVVRFAYSADSSHDAPADRVITHVRALAPVLNANADVIATLQAGFIGRWGEWYYSDNFASDPARPWLLSDADWEARDTVLRTLLEATSPSLFVQVRSPSIKQRLLAGAPSAVAARVGIHDDCFLAGTDDYGTFATSEDRTWLRAQTQTVPMGGETCVVNTPRTQWSSASSELAAYHWSYLNADYRPEVMSSWGAAGLDEVRRRLGYRLRLTTVTLPRAAVAGGTLSGQVGLLNDGYAAPFRARPAKLVLRSADGSYGYAIPLDVRTLAPGVARTTSFTVPVSVRPGAYRVLLSLPDPSPTLAAKPAYAIQLANQGTWDAQTGWNTLGQLDVIAAQP